MVATPRIHHRKEKNYYLYTGICSDVRFGAHSNTLQNVRRAIAERVLFVPDNNGGLKTCPKPLSKGYLLRTMRPFHSKLRVRIRNDSSFPIPPMSSDDFVSCYVGAKKKRYQEACDSLLSSSATQRDASLKSFVKVEKINFSSKSDPAPRIIQPRSFRYSAALGMNIKHLEKPLFKIIDDIFGGPTVLKGYDCIQTATHIKSMWDSFERPVAIGLDASRFDQHCSEEMLEWEHGVWKLMCTDKSKVDQLLRWQRDNRGVAYVDDGKIKYNVKGCRMSGDMNTSSGNCLIMCAMVWCYCTSLGIKKFRLANNGDDCTLIVEHTQERRVLTNLNKFFLDLGYTMKIEPSVYELEQINFCQTQPVFDGVGYRMVRDPRVSMAKDLCCLLDLSNSRTRALWHDAMNQGGSSLTTGIPMWQEFYAMYPRSELVETKKEITLDRFRESGFYRMIPKVPYKGYRVPTPESRYSFWLAFGIHPDTQLVVEDRFKCINLGECAAMGNEDYAELSVLVE